MALRAWARWRGFAAGTALLSIAFATSPAAASGFYLQEQSARGLGRANAGEVADMGAASLWWNPAAIGGLDRSSATFSATYIVPSGRISDNGSTIDRPVGGPMPVGGGADLRNPVQKGLLPGTALGLRLNDRWAVGLGIAAPYGLTSEYPEEGWTRYSGLTSHLRIFDIQPVLAFAPTDEISIGFGLNIQYADAELTNAMPNIVPGSPDGRVELRGTGWDLGWSAGVQFRPSPRLSFGLSYKSAVEHKLKGDATIEGLLGPLAGANYAGDASASFSTPWHLSGGARWQATERLTLNVQATRFGWSRFDSIRIGAPLNTELQQNYRDTTSVALGADYELSETLTLRAGIQNDPSPTPDAGEPRVPDADRVMYTAGGSYRLSNRLTLDGAFAYVDLERGRLSQRDVFYAGTPGETVVMLEGTTRRQKVLMVSVGARLGF